MRKLLIGSVILCFSGVAGATVVIDLTATGGATLTGGIGGSILDATSAPTTVGTGSIDSFVRIQNSPTEQGYNTDANNVDDNKGGAFTHSLLLSALDSTTKAGYFTFLLDINETSPTSLISIDALQIYTASTGNLSQSGTPGPGATLRYDFKSATSAVCSGSGACTGSGSPNAIVLDYNNNSGSGNGFDMFLYVKQDLFTGLSGSTFVYLYSAFGGLASADSSDAGFEEWARISGTGQVGVPEPVSSTLVGVGLIGLFFLRRRATR
jgi:hypothetical protein